MEEYLQATEYIDFNTPSIKSTLDAILNESKAQTNEEKTIAIYKYIRDEIKFGFDKKFWDYKASEVLISKIGFCNTKSTLFVALLRAANIPSRQHFVGINAKVLDGFGGISERVPYVDHIYTEVYLNDKWVKLDGYVVDSELFKNAKLKLEQERNSRSIGYGVHINGEIDWDGKTDCMVQFVQDDQCKDIMNGDHGVFKDVGTYYKTDMAIMKFNLVKKIIFWLLSGGFNKNVSNIRDGK